MTRVHLTCPACGVGRRPADTGWRDGKIGAFARFGRVPRPVERAERGRRNGAEWIGNAAAEPFPGHRGVLDFFHAALHLGRGVRAEPTAARFRRRTGSRHRRCDLSPASV